MPPLRGVQMNPETFKMKKHYFYVDPREIYFLKFILEGYDGLGVINTIDREKGLIRVVVPECQTEVFEMLVSALSEELRLIPADVEEGEGEVATN